MAILFLGLGAILMVYLWYRSMKNIVNGALEYGMLKGIRLHKDTLVKVNKEYDVLPERDLERLFEEVNRYARRKMVEAQYQDFRNE